MGKLMTLVISVLVVANGSPQRPLPATWQDATGNLTGMASECGTLTLMLPVPDSEGVLAGVASRGLFRNTSGTQWTRIGNSRGSERILNRPNWIAFDPDNPAVFWEAGIYGPGLFKTADGGSTFKQVGSLPHLDSVSVDFTDPKRQTILAGGHEASQTVHKSTDGGETWVNIGANLPADSRFSTSPLIINGSTYLTNTQGFGPGRPGIYRTTDGGDSWQQVSALGPVGAPLVTSKGVIYWGMEDGILVSVDRGVTWARIGSNLLPIRPVELPNGGLASINATHVVLSIDGKTWSPIGPPVPLKAHGLIYSPARKTFFVWKGECAEAVQFGAIMSLEYDVSTSEQPVRRKVSP